MIHPQGVPFRDLTMFAGRGGVLSRIATDGTRETLFTQGLVPA